MVGLLPPPLGGCEGKDEQNLLGGRGPSDDVNGGMEVGRPSVAMEIACCQLIALSSVQYSKIRKFARTPATAKNLVFQCEKAANEWHGPETAAKGQKEAMRAE